MQVPLADKHEQSDNSFFNEILFKYLSYWPLFLVLLLISIACSWLYLKFVIPVYEIEARILIKDEKKGFDDAKLLESLDLFGSKKVVENEIEVIRSKALTREVAKNLYLYAPVMQEKRFSDRSAYATSPVQIAVFQPDSLTEAEHIPFTYIAEKGEIVLESSHIPLGKWVTTKYGVIQFLPNVHNRVRPPDNQFYFSLISVKKIADDLLKNLTVSASDKQSTVIDLSYKDQVPQRGEDILNDLIFEYDKASIRDKNILAANTLAFVEDRLRYVVKELDSVEGKLQRFKSQNKIVDISAQGQLFLQTVGSNDQKLNEINMQLASLDQVENYVKDNRDKGIIAPSSIGVGDPVLSQLLQKLYEAQLEYDRLKKTTAENNPMLMALVDQMKQLKPSILENIHNQRASLEAGRNELANTNVKYSSVLQNIPQKERELLEISRQQTIKNNIYTFLLQKREETALAYASTVADSRLVDRAEAGTFPISPKKPLVYFIAVMLAFALGAGYIYFKEVANRNILYRSEIEEYTATPVLAEIVQDNSKNPLVIAEGKRTFIAEQFRHLRTSLGYFGINSRKKRILVTSCISGDGKSFITANLAISLALMGKKVVMLELDLRKPKLSLIFNSIYSTGLSNYFIGENGAEGIIHKTDINKNLFVIPAGPIPENPSELITNGKIQELLTYLDDLFDFIIIDTAPINPVTDAYIIAPLCDATLFVVRHGHTPKALIKKLDGYNRLRELKNMAIIFNGVKNRGFINYGYGYGYEYEYGYTDSKKQKKRIKVL